MHGARGAGVATGRRRALHPVEQALLGLGAHEAVEADLAAEVVVEGARGHAGGGRQVDHVDLGEAPSPKSSSARRASRPFAEVETGIHSRTMYNRTRR